MAVQVDERGRAAPMPPLFKHTLLGGAQLLVVTLACAAVGIFTEQGTFNEYLGHTGLGIALVAAGVLTMVGPTDMTRLVRWEGWIAFAGGAGYVLGDTFYAHAPWGVFDGAGQSEQFHVGLTALLAATGLFAVLYVRVLGRATALHAVIIAAAFSLMVAGHHQHAEASALAHNASALFAVISVIFRIMGRRIESGVCIILTGYLLYAGQVGFVAFMTRMELGAVPWVAAWATLGAFVSAAYLAAFPDEARRVGSL